MHKSMQSPRSKRRETELLGPTTPDEGRDENTWSAKDGRMHDYVTRRESERRDCGPLAPIESQRHHPQSQTLGIKFVAELEARSEGC